MNVVPPLLESIQFCKYSNLVKYIFTPSIALSICQLSFLEVKECNTIEAVIMDDQEASTDHNLILFPRLRWITIESCCSLTSFYLGSRALEFPLLNAIEIRECPKMATFASSLGDLNATAPFFTQQISSPKLEWLQLYSINIQTIWHHQPLPSLNVENLVSVKVKGCHNLKYLFSSFMLKHLVQLISLCIEDCKMMEQVIFMQGFSEERMSMLFPKLDWLWLEDLPSLSTFCFATYFEFPCLTTLGLNNCPLLKTFISKPANIDDELQIHQNAQATNLELANFVLFNERVVFPSLKNLTIKAMRDCRKIWQDQLSKDSFSKLKDVLVESNEQLLNIFPFNMMGRLKELEELHIVNCDSVEEIVESQGIIANEAQVVTKFVFPRVTQLALGKLPKLKSFYSGIHATEWPLLKEMAVIDCNQVELFASESVGFSQNLNQSPLFRVNEVTFPILEELRWNPNDTLNGTWYGEVISTECFRKLKVLTLLGVPEKSPALPYSLIQSLPNLEKLVVHEASFCQIFQFEGLNTEETQTLALTLAQLTELRLSKLPELTHLWKKDQCQSIALLSNLRILQVQECGKLSTLVPSLAAFKNLTTLEVSRCHGFINLMACSTAKTLDLLQKLSLTDCEIIKEIIAGGADEIKGDIIFSKLNYLELSCLPSLESFCLGDHDLKFPVLEEVIVRECPKMMIFCKGELSAPKLEQVQLTGNDEEEKGLWECDLKTTVQRIFEMNVKNSEVTDEATLQLEL